MPANAVAAQLTDGYRRRLLTVRDAVSRTIAGRFAAVDLDRDLDRQLANIITSAATLLTVSQSEAVRVTAAYLAGFAAASGIDREVEAPDPDEFAGRGRGGVSVTKLLGAAAIGLKWRLGQGAGRPAAVTYTVAAAARVTRDSVMTAARASLADTVTRHDTFAGVRRVTSGKTCGVCLALADGTVLRDGRLTALTHDSCRCTFEPIVAGVKERVRRPTGIERYALMSEAEKSELFTGTGGALKAALVDEQGLDVLVTPAAGGRVSETPLAALT